MIVLEHRLASIKIELPSDIRFRGGTRFRFRHLLLFAEETESPEEPRKSRDLPAWRAQRTGRSGEEAGLGFHSTATSGVGGGDS